MKVQKTLDQIALEALLKHGKGTNLDINNRYAEIFHIPKEKWLATNSYYRGLLIMVFQKIAGKNVNFVASGKQLKEVSQWISENTTNSKIKKCYGNT